MKRLQKLALASILILLIPHVLVAQIFEVNYQNKTYKCSKTPRQVWMAGKVDKKSNFIFFQKLVKANKKKFEETGDAKFSRLATKFIRLKKKGKLACKSFCGNAVIDTGEACDDGNLSDADSCSVACLLQPFCGDGVTNPGEACDDGNTNNSDACRNTCVIPLCGDGIVDAGDECDDSNSINTDSCRNNCVVPVCGDGIVDSGEECDDNLDCNQCLRDLAVDVQTGTDFSCALLESGAVRCWGSNTYGQLGYGNTEIIGDDETPASVGNVPLGGKAVQISIAAGGIHACALMDTGNVRCWGYNDFGQLGYSNTNLIGDNETPASIGDVNVGSTVKQVAAGQFHTCALLTNGNVRCWGFGYLGYGNGNSIGDDEDPATAGDVSIGAEVAEISAGRYFTCARLVTGGVKCWGDGGLGILGYGNSSSVGLSNLPSDVGTLNLNNGVASQITSGIQHSCALMEGSNQIYCWGRGQNGRLGYANISDIGDDEVPAVVNFINLGNSALSVSAGSQHTCARIAGNDVICWGDGSDGKLGYGNETTFSDSQFPNFAGTVNVGGEVSKISAGGSHTCAVLTTGQVRCWGYGSAGQLGYGNTNSVGDNEFPSSAGNVPLFLY